MVPTQCCPSAGDHGVPLGAGTHACWEEKAALSRGLESARERGPSCILTASSFTAAEAFVKLPSKQLQFPGKDSSLLVDGFLCVPQDPPRSRLVFIART